jgi:hypothetical protein
MNSPCCRTPRAARTARRARRFPDRFALRQAQGVIDGLGLHSGDVLNCPYPIFHSDAADKVEKFRLRQQGADGAWNRECPHGR